MDGESEYSIGELARLTGLSVRTIRFYGDSGIAPPTRRSQAGQRRYSEAAAARLELLRTLRELGIDLPTIRRVLDRELSLSDVASAHVAAITVQIAALRRQRSVLVMAGRRGLTMEEIDLVHRLATLTRRQRQQLIDEFVEAAFAEPQDADFVGIIRSLTPDLPDDPEPEQLQAWVDLAELLQDTEFRVLMRELVDHHARECRVRHAVAPDVATSIRRRVEPALAGGVVPESPQADPVVMAIATRYRASHDDIDATLMRDLLGWLRAVSDPRRQTYLELLSVINGWSAPDSMAPVLDWSIRAVQARIPA